MKSVFHKALVVAALSAVSLCAAAADKKEAAKEPVVKKSDSGICHDKTSPHYEKTKKFTEFKSMDECVKSGGKPPKK